MARNSRSNHAPPNVACGEKTGKKRGGAQKKCKQFFVPKLGDLEALPAAVRCAAKAKNWPQRETADTGGPVCAGNGKLRMLVAHSWYVNDMLPSRFSKLSGS